MRKDLELQNTLYQIINAADNLMREMEREVEWENWIDCIRNEDDYCFIDEVSNLIRLKALKRFLEDAYYSMVVLDDDDEKILKDVWNRQYEDYDDAIYSYIVELRMYLCDPCYSSTPASRVMVGWLRELKRLITKYELRNEQF